MKRETRTVQTMRLLVSLLVLTLLYYDAREAKASSRIQYATNQEAQQQAERFWATKLTRCGDFYYTRERSVVIQMKEVGILITARSLTHADRLNGVAWKGTSAVTGKVFRRIGPRQTMERLGKWHWISFRAGRLAEQKKGAPGCRHKPAFRRQLAHASTLR